MARSGEYMALYNLNRIQGNASNMEQLMKVNDTLPEWAKSKLTQSRSHLSNVADYKRSKPLGSFYRIYDQLGSVPFMKSARPEGGGAPTVQSINAYKERIAQEERLAMQAAQQEERLAMQAAEKQYILNESARLAAGREAALNDAERTRKWVLTGIVLTSVLYIANKRVQFF